MNNLDDFSKIKEELVDTGFISDVDYKKAYNFLNTNAREYFSYLTKLIQERGINGDKIRVSDNEIILLKKSDKKLYEISYKSYFGDKLLAWINFNSLDSYDYESKCGDYAFCSTNASTIAISNKNTNIYGTVTFDLFDNNVDSIRMYEYICPVNLYRCISISKDSGVWRYGMRHGEYYKINELGNFEQEKNLFNILRAKRIAKNISFSEKNALKNMNTFIHHLSERVKSKINRVREIEKTYKGH